MKRENIKTFKDMDEIHEKARVVITKEFNEMLEKAYMCGFEDGKKGIEKTASWRSGGYDNIYPVCNNCDFVASSRYNYCPNCGAKMEGKVKE